MPSSGLGTHPSYPQSAGETKTRNVQLHRNTIIRRSDHRFVVSSMRSHSLHPIMADAPFRAGGVTKQPGGRQEEPAPAPHPEREVVAIDGTEHVRDLMPVAIKTLKPVHCG